MSIEFKQPTVVVTWKGKPLAELDEAELRAALAWATAEIQRLQKLVPLVRQQDPRWVLGGLAGGAAGL